LFLADYLELTDDLLNLRESARFRRIKVQMQYIQKEIGEKMGGLLPPNMKEARRL
jgi:hypothetical protein